MKNVVKLPSGINPVGGQQPTTDPATTPPLNAWEEFLSEFMKYNGNHSGTNYNDGHCKHDLRTSFLEKEVVVYCTKCEYKITGAKAYGK